MPVYDKFVTGANVDKYRAVGCQLNVPLTSGSHSNFQAVQNTVFDASGIAEYANVLDSRFKNAPSSAWERPGSTIL